jgi:hypothetical protein
MFGVQGAESFQAEYQKLIDTWMQRFTEIENSLAQNKSKLNQEKDKEIEKESLGRGDITISIVKVIFCMRREKLTTLLLSRFKKLMRHHSSLHQTN